MDEFVVLSQDSGETLGETLRRLRGATRQVDLAAALLAPYGAVAARDISNLQNQLSRYENDRIINPDELLLERIEQHYGLASGLLSAIYSRQKREIERRKKERSRLGNGLVDRQFPMGLLPEDEEREDEHKKA